MKKPKLVVGHLTKDELSVKSITISKHFDWIRWLEPEEFVAFFADLLKLVMGNSERGSDSERGSN
ncbi:hypothetical protein C6496_21670 [Candidatus Poribacteria bacterium]|nr:MAG: hypothetical protein C6496_21670 [Candidatus Poribacteria bacterium]